MSAGPDNAHVNWVLRLADTALVAAQRLGEQVGHAPSVEEDLALANMGLDLLGQARLLLGHAGELEGAGRDEDALAFERLPEDFLNLSLVEQPNTDFAWIIVRQLLLAVYQHGLYAALADSADQRLAEIAAQASREVRYHRRWCGGWLVRLGDGTEVSHQRAQAALDGLYRFTVEMFSADDVDASIAAAGIAPPPATLAPQFETDVRKWLQQATLRLPDPVPYRWFGKRGQHGEAHARLIAEMQYLPRTHPGARW